MPASRPQLKPADYLVMSLSPVLVMLLVGSLCFFLVRIFYIGDGDDGVRWVLFWYVLAVVLISRIGIEQGSGPAMVYGLMLAMATWLYLVRIHPAYLLGAVLLGVVWWCAHKLTCDCTLIDETEDASGQGLLQLARRKWWQIAGKKAEGTLPGTARPVGAANPARPTIPKPPKISEKKPEKRKNVLHPPGVWLIYFSAAALPLFGIGQTLLPAADLDARRHAFDYLLVYLCAAMGLLLTTSFLGLRRYLRQRYLAMPARIALGWLQFGGGLAAIVLVLAFLLPRPGVGTAWKTLGYHIDHQLRQASEYAMRFNAPGKGSGRAGEQGQPNSPSDSHSKSDNPQSEQSQPQSGNTPSSTQSSGQGGEQQSGSGQKQTTSTPPTPALSGAAGVLYRWLKLLLIVVGVGVVGWWLYRQRELLRQIFQSLLAAMTHFFQNLFGSKSASQAAAVRSSVPAKPAQFASYKNPFVTGSDRQWPAQQLILYSYEALQSWAAEQGVDTNSKQTAREFCNGLGEKYAEVSPELKQLALLYGHAAYGTSVPANYNREAVRSLWAYISIPRAG